MLKTAFVGALALAVMGPSLANAETPGMTSTRHASAAEGAGGLVVTNAHIARLKAVLKLNAEQRRYWPRVESALRQLAHRRAPLLADGQEARRVMILAMPLINSLNDDQRREALTMARTMGFSAVASAM